MWNWGTLRVWLLQPTKVGKKMLEKSQNMEIGYGDWSKRFVEDQPFIEGKLISRRKKQHEAMYQIDLIL